MAVTDTERPISAALRRRRDQAQTMPLDLDRCIAQLKECETLTENEVLELCDLAKEILVEESNVQRVDAPVTICGDIHK